MANNARALLAGSCVPSLHPVADGRALEAADERRAIEVDAEIDPGYPLQSAIDDLEALADRKLPPGISMITQGETATLQETTRDTLITYGFALLIVFLVLVTQFESLTSALVVMLIVPFGLAATVFTLFLTGTSLNIYCQVGLILLIGLIAKNGILMIEFADQLRDRGASVREAISGSARVRLRPVTMTLVSTVFGALILSSGPGAEARHATGWVVFGGLGLAALFTLFLTPVLYLGIARFASPRSSAEASLDAQLEAAAGIEDLDHEAADGRRVEGTSS